MSRSIAMGLGLTALFWSALATAAPPAESADRVDYQQQIRPLLAQRCFRCHGPDAARRQAGLRLDLREGATQDLGGRRAVAPGAPDDSVLLARTRTADESLRMPPPEAGERLTAGELELLSRWIAEGADYAPHWLFAPLVRPAVPQVADATEIANPIDAFVVAPLESRQAPRASLAQPRVLRRRLALDLCGLPPDAVSAPHVEDATDDAAWLVAVDRLLAHPAYGERLATWWLDLVRYADTVGYHGDQEHHISPYRDYVIEAFNQDLPFDRFTREQLAGDLLPAPTLSQQIASGYNRVLQTSHEGGVQKAEYQKKYDADRVRNLGSVWLGMTTACAECHDHKYDPLPQRDFYRLAAFFADVDDTRTFDGGDTNPTRREPEIEVLSEEDRQLLQQLADRLQELQGRSDSPPTELQNVRGEIDAVRRRSRRTMITRRIDPRPIRVLHRGDWMDQSGELVEPGMPAALAPFKAPGQRASRLDLAEWLTTANRGQTARVCVNRLWSLFFGQGLSRSLDDSGVQGDWPSHPELLDWLAAQFIDSGWSVKHVVRLIVSSRAYRRTSRESAELRVHDPDNRHLTRQGRWRLPAEMVRDQALSAGVLLVWRLGGRPIRPWQPAGFYVQLNFPRREYQPDLDDGQYRRGVYMHWQRQYLHPMLRAFDAPLREECTTQRHASNTPQAALVLLNDPTFLECSRGLAARVSRSPGSEDADRLRFLWQLLLLREPTESEQRALNEYLVGCRGDFAQERRAGELLSVGRYVASVPGTTEEELAVWTAVSRLALNLSELLTRE